MKTKTKNLLYFSLYAILNIILLFQIIRINLLPPLYLAGAILVMLLLAALIYFSLVKSNKKSLNNMTKFFTLLLSLILLVANVYIYRAGSFLNNISSGVSKKDTVSVVVSKDSPYESLEDVKDLTFGKEDEGEEIVLEAIKDFEKELNEVIITKDFEDYPQLTSSLISGDSEVIILNEAFRNIVEDEIENFSEETKVIHEFNKKTVIKRPEKKVTKEGFTVMISGIDVYGSISNNSRSDVNILATVNPKTKEVLLVSIPRDYYLPLGCQTGALDKLTHSGIYGVDCTMKTVGNALDVDIDYYARVNFSSLINVVEAVGGITVNVEAPFSTGKYSFPAGENYLDGNKALEFVRDRYHQEGGDRGRGRNQMKVITALINRMTSPAIITNYSSVLNSLEGSFQTNMSSKDITSLVKMQLNDMSGWNITEMQVDGSGGSDFAYALGGYAYVMYPNQETVDAAKLAIDNTLAN